MAVLWVRHDAEELRREHHRTTVAPDDARAVVMALLFSGRVPPLQTGAGSLDLDFTEALAGRGVPG